MAKFRKTVAVLALLLIGWIVGPVAWAAGAAAFVTDKQGRIGLEAIRLVDVYEARLPYGHLFLTILPPPYGSECGYDPDILFPEQHELETLENWDEFEQVHGYETTNSYMGDEFDDSYIGAITHKIEQSLSPFEIRFLRRCIESTVLSEWCAGKVERFGASVHRYDHEFRQSIADEWETLLCGYLDGVAAQKGIPLADPKERDVN